MPLLLGMDVGTQGARAIVCDERGRKIGLLICVVLTVVWAFFAVGDLATEPSPQPAPPDSRGLIERHLDEESRNAFAIPVRRTEITVRLPVKGRRH